MRRMFGTTARNVLLSIGALGVTGGIAAMGTFASFTSTTSASQTTQSGTVTIALGATGASTNRLAVNASGLVPGDTVQRSFDLNNSGDQSLASITFTSSAAPSSLLDSDATNGLQMVIDRCSSAWTESGSSPSFTYSCNGSTTTIIASRPVVASGVSMAGLSALATGGTDHLRVTLTLPSATGNSLQGLSSTITYSFVGTQRNGTNQ